MRIAGIDCGTSGFVSVLEDGKYVGSFKMPCVLINKRKKIDGRKFISLLTLMNVDEVVLEQQFMIQGQQGGFQTGFSYGYLCGLLTAMNVKFTTVTAQKWQKQIFGGRPEDTKKASIASVLLWDNNIDLRKTSRCRVASHDKADSICLARYGFILKEMEQKVEN